MAASTVAEFIAALRQLPLLEPDHCAPLAALQRQFPDLKPLANELVRRGWLTAFQANQVAAGKGAQLVLDQYILLDLLGQGGMGAVYKARHQGMKRLVALKVIRAELLKKPEALARFRREAEIAARLAHPNVVTVHDSNTESGRHYLVMEYIDGTDLAQLVETRGPLPVAEACESIRQAALGLQHAHEQGLVHRDIKPHNLMLTKQGVVKLMDLGLARTAHAAGATALSKGLTGAGAMMGTPDYLAPEQARDAKRVDIRADIYSLGCTLYHLLAGRVPLPAESLPEAVVKHLMHEPDPIENVRPDVPAGLGEVVRKMMAKQPEDRFQTPGDVAAALGPYTPCGDALRPSAAGQDTFSPPISVAETLSSRKSTAAPAPGTVPRDTAPAAPGRSLILVLSLLVSLLVIGFGALLGMFLFRPGAEDRPQAATMPAPETRKDAPKTAPTEAKAEPLPIRKDPTQPKEAPPVVTKEPPKKEDPKTDPVEAKEPPYTGPKYVRLPAREYVTNSAGMVLVKIPAGTFTIGSPREEKERDADEEQHEVEVTRAFRLSIFPVTQEQYAKVMKKNPSFFSPAGGGKSKVQGLETRHFPVESVTWQNAKDFCDALSALPEEIKAGRVYRLPTEAEWEYACRGGAQTYSPFHFGDTLTSELANFNGNVPYPGDAGKGPYLGRTTLVGSYKPNAFGLYDMHGNVWQWCADWYGPYSPVPRKDPAGPPQGTVRVLRGGSWVYTGRLCRSANRGRYDPGVRYYDNGFRVLCTVR